MGTQPDIKATRDAEKQAAARAAVQLVESGSVVGLGSGSTATSAIHYLAERVRDGLKIVGIPTSKATQLLAQQLGIPLTTLEERPVIDIDIDGADEIDPQLNLIKGGGGAMLREKVIASASQRFVVVAESVKLVPHLGKFPLPVEVISFAESLVKRRIEALGAHVSVRRHADGSFYVTDEGHHILDCNFGEIADPASLNAKLHAIPGVVEHGLFVGMAEMAFVGKDGGVVQLKRGLLLACPQRSAASGWSSAFALQLPYAEGTWAFASGVSEGRDQRDQAFPPLLLCSSTSRLRWPCSRSSSEQG